MMIPLISLAIYMVCIGLVYKLLLETVDWRRFFVATPESAGKLRLLVAILAVSIGFLLGSFFVTLVTLTQGITTSILH